VRIADTDHSLKARERGPTLLQDHHLREKAMQFDHERIPERSSTPRVREPTGRSSATAAPQRCAVQVSSPKG
jgi:hypothetical protein